MYLHIYWENFIAYGLHQYMLHIIFWTEVFSEYFSAEKKKSSDISYAGLTQVNANI